MSRVELRGVWKRYSADVTAVRELDLEIREGEFTVLVGPSGCGKTTTLRMVAGLESISEGDLLIADRRVNDVPPRDRDIAMVFQSYALYPHMTVFENMAFGLRLRKVPKSEILSRVTGAAATLGLGGLLKRKPKALSGGQRQRVAMGRAIVRNPRVFLFDEPLSNLDAKLRHEMRIEIARLHRRLGTTILYVTHDQVEAMTLADRIAIMKGGLLQQYGSPLVVYNRPANRFVAGFIGSPAMNFLAGEVVSEGGPEIFRGDGFELPLPQRREGEFCEVGVRPQSFLFDPEGPLEAAIDIVEPLGPETFVHFTWGATPIVARVDSEHQVRPGDALRFRVEARHVHCFAPGGNTL